MTGSSSPVGWKPGGAAGKPNRSWYLDPLVARQKREENLACVRRWNPDATPCRVLKTDVFEEANGDDRVLDDLFPKSRLRIGMDIAFATARAAQARGSSGPSVFLTADVRALPLPTASIDLIFSNSTLDHFESAVDFTRAIGELARVLRPAGRLILTLDNPWNPLYWPLRLLCRTRWAPFSLGYTTSAAGMARTLREAGLAVVGEDVLIHNPRLISTFLFRGLRLLMGARADGPVRVLLCAFAALHRLPTRRFTACFNSVCAEKPLA
jgi:SAM-dependent methyltransferase